MGAGLAQPFWVLWAACRGERSILPGSIRPSVIGTTRQATRCTWTGIVRLHFGRGTYSETGSGVGRWTERIFPDRRRLVGDPVRCALRSVCCWHLQAIPVKARQPMRLPNHTSSQLLWEYARWSSACPGSRIRNRLNGLPHERRSSQRIRFRGSAHPTGSF